jgi:predicted  nucleic acid-binding Zn-ribbon protein
MSHHLPFVHATTDRPSGLHELWLMRKDAAGFMEPIAGPAPWPKGWAAAHAAALLERCPDCGHAWESEAHAQHGACRECQTSERAAVPSEPAESAVLLHRAVMAEAEVERLRALINSPHIDNFERAVRLEAAHQQERWGADHDEGKTATDWIFLAAYLCGKAAASFAAGNRVKGMHHIISSAAVLLNWHKHAAGEPSRMRPGIATPEGAQP